MRGTRVLLLAALLAGPASAAVEVFPIRIELTRAATNTLVTLVNTGTDETRFELQPVSWSQDGSGNMRLENTRDVTVYPPLLALKPGERRNVRVAVPGSAFGAVERTYRVIIQELPGAPKTGSARQVQVLTRLSIPVFVRPDTVREDVRVEGLAVEKGSVVFRVVNAGNVTERPESVTVEARDAGGTTVASTRWEGWYVLSGERREYAWPVPASACKQAASVAVTVKLESRELAARSAVPRGACGE